VGAVIAERGLAQAHRFVREPAPPGRKPLSAMRGQTVRTQTSCPRLMPAHHPN